MARQLIEQEHDQLHVKFKYLAYDDPKDDLLSERGLALRVRARRFGRVALVCAVLIFAWAAWAN